jgi:hypothetical protein
MFLYKMFYISNSVLAGVCAGSIPTTAKKVFVSLNVLVSWIEEKVTSQTTFIVFLYGL